MTVINGAIYTLSKTTKIETVEVSSGLIVLS